MVVVAFVADFEAQPRECHDSVVECGFPVADFHVLMLALPNGFFGTVSRCCVFVRPVVVGTLPYIIAHVHVDEVVGAESVLVAKHDIGSTGVTALVHVVDIARPLLRQIAEVCGRCASPFVSERSDGTQINGVLVIGLEVRACTEEHAVFMLVVVSIRVKVSAIFIAAT